jgi:hypothetical protein
MSDYPLHDGEVRVLCGTTSLAVSGRAAFMILQIARHADHINAPLVGKLVAHFAHQQVKLEVRESLPPLRLSHPQE